MGAGDVDAPQWFTGQSSGARPDACGTLLRVLNATAGSLSPGDRFVWGETVWTVVDRTDVGTDAHLVLLIDDGRDRPDSRVTVRSHVSEPFATVDA